MRRILLVFAVTALLAAMVVIMALPAFAASHAQRCSFAAQRSADASGVTGQINPPSTTEGSILSTRQGANANEYHKCV
jgi:uncharacterized membrane protein